MTDSELKVACDAMCGGVARWLRALGCDTFYQEGIDDRALVELAQRECRIVITSDTRLLERRVFTSGEIGSVLVPTGLKLDAQVEFVSRRLGVTPGTPRCTLCNGELIPVSREEVADVVPARSLIWGRGFGRCRACGHVFWEGTHWKRIAEVRDRLATGARRAASDDREH